MQVWELLRAAATIVDEGWASGCDAQDLEGRPIPLFYGEGRATINVWHGGKWHGGRFGARSRSPSAPAGISVGPLITVDRGDTTFAASSGFRFRVALVISARREFRSAPDNRRPRGYLGGVRWGCPWRSPKTLAVSGGVSLRCQGRSFWRRVHFLRASPRRLSYRRAGPLVPQSSPASWLANRPCHCH